MPEALSPVVTVLLNLGVLGVVVLLGLLGWIHFKPSVDDIKAERDRALADKAKAEAQRDEMAKVLQDRLLPVIGDFITTTRSLLPILQELARRGRDRND